MAPRVFSPSFWAAVPPVPTNAEAVKVPRVAASCATVQLAARSRQGAVPAARGRCGWRNPSRCSASRPAAMTPMDCRERWQENHDFFPWNKGISCNVSLQLSLKPTQWSKNKSPKTGKNVNDYQGFLGLGFSSFFFYDVYLFMGGAIEETS